MTLESLWRDLEAADAPASGLVERRLPASGGCELYVAVRKPGNSRLVIARVRGSGLSQVALPPASRGITSVVSTSDDVQAVELALADPAFADVFNILVADLERTLAVLAPAQEALDRLLGRVRMWQQFFAAADPLGLSYERIRGLFGELWFIREHLLGLLGPDRAIAAWTGSSATDQDFQMPGCAIEVKTTGTKQPQRLHIASERQLDVPGIVLVLCHVSVDVRVGAGLSLPRLVEEIRGFLPVGSMTAALFDDKLVAYGYVDIHAERYRSTGFSVRESNLFEVVDGFPRIVEADLRSGVGDVRYTLLVDTLRPYSVAATRLRELIQGDDR